MEDAIERYSYQIDPEDTESTAAKILRLTGKGKRVLELGTAGGTMTEEFKRRQCTVVGVEIDPLAAKKAELNCERMIVGDLDKLDLVATLPEDRFDVVVAADVLEHLVDPQRLLNQLGKLLKPDGYLVVSVPSVGFNGLLGAIISGEFPYRETGLLDRTHLRFFTRHELETLLVIAGLLPDIWEPVELGAADSEFREHWRRLPAEVRSALESNPEGNTYQYVARARPADPERWNRYLRKKKNREDEVRHNLKLANLRNNDLSARLEIVSGELQRVKQDMQFQLQDMQFQLQHMTERNEQVEKELQTILSSTSWRLSLPIRIFGKCVHRLRLVLRLVSFLAARPVKIRPSFRRLHKAWRLKGMQAVKQIMINIPMEVDPMELWQAYRKKLNSEGYAQIKQLVDKMNDKPLISILLPTYNTEPAILRETLDSVLGQLYPAWQLCVVDDASPDREVRNILKKYAGQDSRIKLTFLETNVGIAGATNRALEMAEGEYTALLDHDDILEKQALYRIAESVLSDNPDLIYSDEVLITKHGKDIQNFVFRPSFSLELLRSHPYIVHLAVVRTELLRRLGGFNEELPISQDYDLFLRVVEQADCIVHIPEVLYCWRQQKSSAGHDKQDLVMETSMTILERHLERCGESAVVEQGKIFNYFEVRYPIQEDVKVAIIIPTKNNGTLVRQCVESIKRTVHNIPHDIVVIDHESSDPDSIRYFDRLKAEHQVLSYQGPFNFSTINNWAVAQIPDTYSHYLFLNNDIEAVTEDWLERMMELGQKDEVGIVGATLFYPENDIYQHAGVCVGMHGLAEHYGKWLSKWLPDGSLHPGYLGSLIANHEVSAVTAACMLIRRDAFRKISGFDDELAVGFGDVDLCLRVLRQGYRVIFCPHAVLIHHESYTRGQTRGKDPHPQDSARFLHRWKSFIAEGDPYYNPNLSLSSTFWDVANPLQFNPRLKGRIFRRRS